VEFAEIRDAHVYLVTRFSLSFLSQKMIIPEICIITTYIIIIYNCIFKERHPKDKRPIPTVIQPPYQLFDIQVNTEIDNVVVSRKEEP
jgi:hypothetical protein